MPKLKPQELETRRTEIIDAARTCFLRSGFHKTTTDEICREANITPGGLYHYFGSKEDLIAAVIDRSAETAVERMGNLVAGSGNAESAFRQVRSIFFQSMQDGEIDDATRLELEIWVEGLKNPKLFEKSQQAWVMRMHWLEMLVQRGLQEGVYGNSNVEPRAMASLLIAIWLGMRMGRLMGEDFDVKGAMRSFVMMIGGQIRSTIDAPVPG
jgi:AcrR family transcriptional regulator